MSGCRRTRRVGERWYSFCGLGISIAGPITIVRGGGRAPTHRDTVSKKRSAQNREYLGAVGPVLLRMAAACTAAAQPPLGTALRWLCRSHRCFCNFLCSRIAAHSVSSGRISLQRACAASVAVGVAQASGVAWWCCGGGAWGHPPQLRHPWTVLTKRLADGSGVVGSMPWPRFMMCGRPAIFLRMSCARGAAGRGLGGGIGVNDADADAETARVALAVAGSRLRLRAAVTPARRRRSPPPTPRRGWRGRGCLWGDMGRYGEMLGESL